MNNFVNLNKSIDSIDSNDSNDSLNIDNNVLFHRHEKLTSHNVNIPIYERAKLHHKEKYLHLSQIKAELEAKKTAEWTFSPSIDPNSRRIAEKKAIMEELNQDIDDSDKPVDIRRRSFDYRLHEDAVQRIHQQRWLAKHVEIAKLSQYPFKPLRIETRYRSSSAPHNSTIQSQQDFRPIYERVYDLQKQSNCKLQNLRLSYDNKLKDEMPFSPKIDKKSEKLANNRIKSLLSQELDQDSLDSDTIKDFSHLSVSERLLTEGSIAKKKRQKLQRFHKEEEQKLIESTRFKIKNNNISVDGEFEERQKNYIERLKSKKDAQMKQQEDLENSWFKPKIYDSSKKIISKVDSSREQEEKDLVFRLSVTALKKRAEKMKQITNEVYKDVTFSPKIDNVSKAIGRRNSIQELYENSRGKKRRESVKEKLDEELKSQCTFKPVTNDYQKGVADNIESELTNHYGWIEYSRFMHGNDDKSRVSSKVLGKDFKEYWINRDKLQNNGKIEKEIRELQDCTFSPEVIAFEYKKELSHQPIVVRGLGKFLELQEQSQKLKFLAKRREEDAFKVKNLERCRENDGRTIVQV